MAPKITQPGSKGDELETWAHSQKMEENNILHRTQCPSYHTSGNMYMSTCCHRI